MSVSYFSFKEKVLYKIKDIGVYSNMLHTFFLDENYETVFTEEDQIIAKYYSKALLEDLFHSNQITLEHRGKELKTQKEIDKAFEEQWAGGYPSDPLDDEYLIIKPKKKLFSLF